jgi:hypothetical protein
MFYWIYEIPTGTAALLFAAFFVVANTLGVYLVRPMLRSLIGDSADGNSLISNAISLYSVMFGLLLGMVAVATYEDLSDAQKVAENEATSLAALYRDVAAYPEPTATTLTTVLKEYTRYVIDVAWPQERKGIVPKGGTQIVDVFQSTLYKFEPKSKSQEALHTEALRQFNQFVINRRARLNAITMAIPPIMWVTVAGGSVVCLILMWLFDANRRTLAVLSGIMAFALGSVIGLIALMDNPFHSEIGVSSDAYQLIYETLMNR